MEEGRTIVGVRIPGTPPGNSLSRTWQHKQDLNNGNIIGHAEMEGENFMGPES